MVSGTQCSAPEAKNPCHVFQIARAAVDSPVCEVGSTEIPVDVHIRGKGHGASFECKIEIFVVKGMGQRRYCELRWDDVDGWEGNFITRSEKLASNTDYLLRAWIRKVGQVPSGTTCSLTVTLEHEAENHKHKVTLHITLR